MEALQFFRLVIAIVFSASMQSAHATDDLARANGNLARLKQSPDLDLRWQSVSDLTSPMHEALSFDLTFNKYFFRHGPAEIHKAHFSTNDLFPSHGLILDLETTEKLIMVHEYLSEARNRHQQANLSECAIDSYSYLLCQEILTATQLPLESARTIFHAEAIRASRCSKALSDLHHHIINQPSNSFRATQALVSNTDNLLRIVEPTVIGRNFSDPENNKAFSAMERRFQDLNFDLYLLLSEHDSWIKIARQANDRGLESLADFVEGVQDVMRRMGKSAASLATASDDVLTCDVAALRAIFENMLRKQRRGWMAPEKQVAQSMFQWAWGSLPFF